MRTLATGLTLSLLASLAASCPSGATPERRIAIGPGPVYSHYVQFTAIAEELASRGNSVMLISSTEDKKFIKELGADKFPNTTVTYYQAPYSEQRVRDGVREARWMHPIAGVGHTFQLLKGFGHALLNDSNAKAALKAFKPHYYLGDITMQAGMALADTLGIPKGLPMITAFAPPLDTDLFAFGANPLLYVPQLGTVLPAKMGFIHRLQNTVAWAISSLLRDRILIPLNNEIWKENGIPGSSRLSLRNATLLLVHADFALARARPLSPHVKVTGPLTATEPKPLPADLEAFAQSAGDDGIVYVSMGTTSIPEESELRDLTKGLSAAPYKVLWKLSNDDSLFLEGKPPLQVGSNVKIVKWCPQNDVLGHPQTKVFVTQGGTNSFMESVYHGVPIVGIPLFAEQPNNVQQAVDGGYAVLVSVFDKNFATALPSAIKEVMSKPRYAEAVQVVSNIIRARRSTPAQRAADAVEEAAWAGHSDHLKAVKHDMKGNEEFNLDVNLFFIAVIGTLLAAVYKSISFATLLVYRRFVVPAAKAGKSD